MCEIVPLSSNLGPMFAITDRYISAYVDAVGSFKIKCFACFI